MTGPDPVKIRFVFGDILLALVILFTVWLSVVMIRRIRTVVLSGLYKRVFASELVVCAVLLAFALDVRFGLFGGARPGPLRLAGLAARIAVCAASILVLALMCRIIVGGMIRDADGERTVVVLGMALENGQPNRDLLLRVKTAGEYAKRFPDTKLILTGGNPDSSGRTEAAVMHDLLLEDSVPERQMVLEDRAVFTADNFRNSAAMADSDGPVVIVSSNYHMSRAVRLAREAGFTGVRRLPAPSQIRYYPANMMWEVMMELNDITRKLKII